MNQGYCFAVNKEIGLTSLKVVKIVKNILNSQKAGHGGALDPMATGVLIVLTDRLSKLTNFCHLLPKKYVAKIRLGLCTDTFDLEGNVVCADPGITVSEDQVLNALESLKGEIWQKPPSASAVKVMGKPAYYYFRRKQAPDLSYRKVTLKDYRLLALQQNDVIIYLETSGGFYVRTCANDLGIKLGACGGCLVELKRVAVGSVSENASIKLSELKKEDALNWFSLFMDAPAIDISDLESDLRRRRYQAESELIKRLDALNIRDLATLRKGGRPIGLVGRFRDREGIQIWLSEAV